MASEKAEIKKGAPGSGRPLRGTLGSRNPRLNSFDFHSRFRIEVTESPIQIWSRQIALKWLWQLGLRHFYALRRFWKIASK